MAQRETLRCRSNRQQVEIEEITDEADQHKKQLPPKKNTAPPSMSSTLNTAVDGLKWVFADLQGMFSPSDRQKTEKENGSELPSPSADHPGIENVDIAEAMEQCPHLKEAMQKKKRQAEGAQHCCDHPCHGTAGRSAGVKFPVDDKEADSTPGKCPVDRKGVQSTPPASAQCPYQDPEAHEWPMRAVLTFMAFNFISTGISIEIVKIGFVVMACYMGMLRAAEFAVLYVTTASMSSYKLLGLLLMLTNRGGPKWDAKMYRINPVSIGLGISTGVLAIGVAMLAKQGEIAYGFYRPAPWTGPAHSPHISPLFNLVVPILNEFVYRQYMLTELGRDLGTWFGLLGSSIWYGIMLKAGKAKLLANFFQGLFFGSAMLFSNKNLVVPTIAHSVYRTAFSLFPSLNQYVVQ
ncbi:hypothetical protein BSKO_00812 [Bryopsis sp. KO-2023]|nr:hypothetical protein BSKO_00812 [Bryopsis sp. KO-2023]